MFRGALNDISEKIEYRSANAPIPAKWLTQSIFRINVAYVVGLTIGKKPAKKNV
jgi:hypothetical protein